MAIVTQTEPLTMYVTQTCGDCRVAKRVFDELGIAYAPIDINEDDAARAEVERLNHGRRTVPTILMPSGAIVVEPSAPELIVALRNEGLIS